MDNTKLTGICAECYKRIPLDNDFNSEYDFYQRRRYATISYTIDYHFCSKKCMQVKMKTQPISNNQARADQKQKDIENLEAIIKEPNSKVRRAMFNQWKKEI